jgi:chitinase
LLPSLWSLSLAASIFSQLQLCPNTCSGAGPNPGNWTFIHSLNKLSQCNETILFDLNLFNSVNDSQTHNTLRSCAVDDVSGSTSLPTTSLPTTPNQQCGNFTATNASVEVASSGASTPLTPAQLTPLFDSLQSQLSSLNQPACWPQILLGHSNGSIVGVYAGASVDGASSLSALVAPLITQTGADLTLAQSCGSGIDSNHTIGLIVTTLANLGVAQEVMQAWSNGTCYTNVDSSSFTTASLWTKPLVALGHNTTVLLRRQSSGSCSTLEVASGDSCATLATACGITAAQLTQFNPSSTLCSGLAPGQHVCCSAGSLPDFAPQPQSDGSCFSYTIQANDNCDVIGAEFSLTETDIMNFNTETWGWQGCGDVQLGQIICLSSG